MDIFDYIKVILILCGFLYVTYWTTKFIAKKQNKALAGKHISVVETVFLGKDKCLHLVRAGDKYLLVASTAKGVELLTTVDIDGSLPENEQAAQQTVQLFDFKAILEKYSNMQKNRKAGKAAKNADLKASPDISEEESDISKEEKFRQNLKRIKDIVQKSKDQLKENGDDITNEK